MGCLFCNLLPPCDKEEEKAFIEELAYDIAYSHPEVVARINYFVNVLAEAKEAGGEVNGRSNHFGSL